MLTSWSQGREFNLSRWRIDLLYVLAQTCNSLPLLGTHTVWSRCDGTIVDQSLVHVHSHVPQPCGSIRPHGISPTLFRTGEANINRNQSHHTGHAGSEGRHVDVLIFVQPPGFLRAFCPSTKPPSPWLLCPLTNLVFLFGTTAFIPSFN